MNTNKPKVGDVVYSAYYKRTARVLFVSERAMRVEMIPWAPGFHVTPIGDWVVVRPAIADQPLPGKSCTSARRRGRLGRRRCRRRGR